MKDGKGEEGEKATRSERCWRAGVGRSAGGARGDGSGPHPDPAALQPPRQRRGRGPRAAAVVLVEPEEEKVLRVRTSRRCYTRSQMDDAYRLITFPRPPLSRTLRDLCRWVSGKGSRPTTRAQGPQPEPGPKAHSQGSRPTARAQGPQPGLKAHSQGARPTFLVQYL